MLCCGEDVVAVSAAGPSIHASGQIGLLAGIEVSSASTSITDSVARVDGGVAVWGGEAAFLSGESGSIADSGRGELMEEWVCLVRIESLHKKS